jgi:hypothetical protein
LCGVAIVAASQATGEAHVAQSPKKAVVNMFVVVK